MGKCLIIQGADFSANGIPVTLSEKLFSLLNSRAFHKGLIASGGGSNLATNVKGMYYTTLYDGGKKCCVNDGGIALSEIIAMGVSSITITPKNGYRFNTAIGNLSTSVMNDGTWTHLTGPLTIDFTDFHSVDWTSLQDCYFLLCVVQKTTDGAELLDLDFSKYLDISVN